MWALRDNNMWGEWDEPVLAELLAELAAGGVDLALTGFEGRDLDRILAGLEQPADPDDAPPLPVGVPDSQPGETYQLGEHRLRLRRCTGSGSGRRRCSAMQRAEVLLTDPPVRGRLRRQDTPAAEDQKRRCRRVCPHCSPTRSRRPTRCWRRRRGSTSPRRPGRAARPSGSQLERVGWQLHQELVWVKNSPVLGHSDYHNQHETFLYGWKPGPGRAGRGRHKGRRWYGDNRQTSTLVLRPAGAQRGAPDDEAGRAARGDASQLEPPRRHRLRPVRRLGLDPDRLRAARRRCFAIEIDPAYCDVIRRRYRELVGG